MVLENNLFLENYFHQTDENGKILVVCSLVGSLLVMPVMYFKTDKKIKDIQNSEIRAFNSCDFTTNCFPSEITRDNKHVYSKSRMVDNDIHYNLSKELENE